MKTATIGDWLTEAEVQRVTDLWNNRKNDNSFKATVQSEIIEPNMARINASLGMENDAGYLAWMILATCMRASGEI